MPEKHGIERVAMACSGIVFVLSSIALGWRLGDELPKKEQQAAVAVLAGEVGAIALTENIDTTTTTAVMPTSTTTTTTPKRTTTTSTTSTTVPRQAPITANTQVTSLGIFQSTCYIEEGTTKSGDKAGPGSISVDPSVIPLGTKLEVEGYGPGIANDTGSKVKNRIIDVWLPDRAQCIQWGRRMVEVWLRTTA